METPAKFGVVLIFFQHPWENLGRFYFPSTSGQKLQCMEIPDRKPLAGVQDLDADELHLSARLSGLPVAFEKE
jgi:hypothetical protein